MSKMQEQIRKKLLSNALQLVPFDGWNRDLLKHASVNAGYHCSMAEIIFPGGVCDLFQYYIAQIDQEMLDKYHAVISDNMKTHHRIRLCLISRLEILVTNKPLLSRSLAFLALPMHYALATRILASTVDLIWYEAGCDQSTDWNYYTKRIMLAAIYSSTILYFANDNSEDFKDTIDFLDKRLENSRNIGQIKRKLINFLGL